MASVQLNGEQLTSWEDFHAQCAMAFGFPEFYGRNLDAFIDCLSYLRDEDGMSKFRLQPDEVLRVEVSHSEALRLKAPDILTELTFCMDALNERYADYGEKPALELVLL